MAVVPLFQYVTTCYVAAQYVKVLTTKRDIHTLGDSTAPIVVSVAGPRKTTA